MNLSADQYPGKGYIKENQTLGFGSFFISQNENLGACDANYGNTVHGITENYGV